jgi:hypothetical protein
MGYDGTVNISSLKNATGINDNRLSAHNPNGAGNNTKFGDFLVDNLGGNTTPDTDNQIDGLYLIPVEVNGATSDAEGSYDSNNYWVFDNISQLNVGDTIKIEVWFEKTANNLGDYFRPMIGTRTAKWDVLKAGGTGADFTLDNIVSYRSGSSYLTTAFVITIDSKADAFGIDAFFSAEVNTDMPNLGSNLQFKTDEMEAPEGLSVTIETLEADSDGTGITCTYTIDAGDGTDQGAPPYDAWLYNENNGSSTADDTNSHSSEGTYSMKDSDAPTDEEQDFRVQIEDDNGQVVEDTQTFVAGVQ